MSEVATLKATPREGTGKGVARKLRAAGRVPAVVYGGDDETVSLSIDAHEASQLFSHISVENTIVALDIEGAKAPVDTLVKEVQVHPFRPDLVHVDFYRVTAGVALDVQIPVHLEGTPEGVRQSGGILEQQMHDVEVRCIPSKIPDHISIDVSGLEVGDSLHVGDLVAPEGSEILTDAERVLCIVVLPKAAISEADAEEEAAEPEVIGGAEAESTED